MIYVALLRGVNVGGKAKVDMKQLKLLFEVLGFSNVRTYINSGNVIFESGEKSLRAVQKVVQDELDRHFKHPIATLVLKKSTIANLTKAVPLEWQNNDQQRTDVLFLWGKIDTPDIVEKVVIHEGIDEVIYTPGALVWHIDRAYYNKSGLTKLVPNPLYKQMTIRNINTLRKLADLAQAT